MEWANLTNIKLHLKTLEDNARQIEKAGQKMLMPDNIRHFAYGCDLMIRDQVELLRGEIDKIKNELDGRVYEACKGLLKPIKEEYEKATKHQPPQLPVAAVILEKIRIIKEHLKIRD